MAITCRQATFAANKAVQIVALRAGTRNSIFNFFSKWTVFSEQGHIYHDSIFGLHMLKALIGERAKRARHS